MLHEDFNIGNNETDKNVIAGCIAQSYCETTDVDWDNVDWNSINCKNLVSFNAKWTPAAFIIFIFLSIGMFGRVLTEDMIEASIEESLLDNVLKNNTMVGWFHYIAAQTIRVSLRVRYFGLPWLTLGATITVIVSDAPYVQNMILNLLAIGVVLEIDNIFALLILSPYQQERMQAFVDDAENQGNVGMSWFSFNFTRFIGISASLIMSFVTRYIQTIQESPLFDCNYPG